MLKLGQRGGHWHPIPPIPQEFGRPKYGMPLELPIIGNARK